MVQNGLVRKGKAPFQGTGGPFARKDQMANLIMQEGGKPVRRLGSWNGVGTTGRECELTRTSDTIRSIGGGTCHGLFGLSL